MRHRKIRATTAVWVGTMALSLLTPTVADAEFNRGFLAGIMRLPDGSPASEADGCLAWLRSEVDEGDPSPIIVRFVTNDRGEFNVPVDMNQQLAESAVLNGGTLNFELTGLARTTSTSSAGEEELPESGPAAEAVEAVTTLYDGAMALAVPVTGEVDAAAGLVLTLPTDVLLVLADTTSLANYEPDPATLVGSGEPDVGCGGEADGPPHNRCGGYWEAWKRIDGPRGEPTIIGELHTYQDMSARFSYSVSANTEIGVSYKYDSKAWNQSGTVHMGNKTSVGNSGVGVASYFGREIEGNFNYVKEKRERWCWGELMSTMQRVRPLIWNGDVFPGTDTSSRDGYYTWKDARDSGGARYSRFLPNQKFWRDSSKTKIYGAGGGPFGVTVSSQTTYNSTHKLSYSFGSDVYWHYLIGDDGPPSSAGVIYAY